MSTISTSLSQHSRFPIQQIAANPRKYIRHSQAYYYAFLIALVLCWSPSKLIAYFAPWLALAIFLFLSRSRVTLHRFILIIALWGMSLPLYALLTPGFAFHSAILTLLTYGAFIFILAVPTRSLANPGLVERILPIARWTLLFQGAWGIVQGMLSAMRSGTFDGSTGDNVAGTIRPFASGSDFSNPMFAINIAMLLLFLFPSLVQEGKGKLAFAVGTFALILASVVHVLLLLSLSMGIAFILYYPSFFLRRRGCITLAATLMAAMLALSLLSSNLASLSDFATLTLEGRTPRSQVVARVWTEMPAEYPWAPLIGIGTGQFSSRAGLIGTGMYFGGPANPQPIPLLPKGMSDPFRDYVLDSWLQMAFNPSVNDSSATYKPFLSWLSLYVEWGLMGVVLVLGFMCYLLWKIRRRIPKPTTPKLTAVACSTGILFIFLLGMQENYWEVTQAIFVGLILLKLQYANLIRSATVAY